MSDATPKPLAQSFWDERPGGDTGFYRALFDPSPNAIWLNFGGRIAYANPACLRLLGATEAEVLGRSPLEFIHPDFHDLVIRRIETAFSANAQVPITEERIVRMDGRAVDVEITAWPIPFEGARALQVVLIDISERKRLLSELRAGREHLRRVLDALFAYVGVLSPDGVLLEANRAPVKAAGLSPADVVGKPFAETVWWSHSAEAQQQIRNAIECAARGVPSRFDVTANLGQGAPVMLDFMIAPMSDEQGRIKHLIASAVDITERKRAEDELRQSQERFRATFENAAVGIAHVGADGRWLRVNQRLCDMLGYSREELERLTFQDITHPDDLEEDLRLAGALAAGEIPSYVLEKRYIHKSGQTVWINLTGSAVRDAAGALLYYISIVEDISARKQAEEALKRSEAEFELLANSVPLLVWTADADGWITWYNRRWFEYTGTTAEQMQGWGWQSVHDPAELPRVLERWRTSLVTAEPFEMVFPLRGADGVFRPFLTRVVPLKDTAGRVQRWFGTNTDISAQRATEDALRAANAELEQFAFVAAHDLQEPLRTTHIYSQLLLRQFEAVADADARTYAGYVQNSVRRMQNLVGDLLEYSQVLHGGTGPEHTAVDLNEIVDDALSVFREQIAEDQARIERVPLPVVRGSRSQLAPVFQNLISNALKYRKPGQPAVIRISARQAGSHCIVAVEDEGIGFDQQYAEKIFGLFRRLHSASEYPGTGLGLAICRRMVEGLGGRIWAEGKPDEGARFFVALPAAQ